MRLKINSRITPGFGLIEVLVASAMIVIVLSGVVFLGNLAIRDSVSAANRTVAQGLAQEAMEGTRQFRDRGQVLGTGDFVLGSVTDGYGLSSGTSQTISTGGVSFARTINITNQGPDGNTNETYRKVTVKVSWTDVNDSQSVEDISFLEKTL